MHIVRCRAIGMSSLLLMLALVAGCGPTTQPASQAATITPTPIAVQGTMPNVVGLLAGVAADQLHAQFGPVMPIEASDGAASTYAAVVSQIPTAGALVSANTPVTLVTASAPTTTPTTTTTVPPTTTTEAPTSTAAPTTSSDDIDVPNPDLPNPKRRSGHSGHPCLPGERDGDGDGYCGEGR